MSNWNVMSKWDIERRNQLSRILRDMLHVFTINAEELNNDGKSIDLDAAMTAVGFLLLALNRADKQSIHDLCAQLSELDTAINPQLQSKLTEWANAMIETGAIKRTNADQTRS